MKIAQKVAEKQLLFMFLKCSMNKGMSNGTQKYNILYFENTFIHHLYIVSIYLYMIFSFMVCF